MRMVTKMRDLYPGVVEIRNRRKSLNNAKEVFLLEVKDRLEEIAEIERELKVIEKIQEMRTMNKGDQHE